MKKTILSIITITALTLITYLCIKNNHLQYYFITYGNYNEKYIVTKEKTNINKIIKDYKNYDYIKIDKIISEKTIEYSELVKLINNTKYNEFNYGLTFDNNINILKEEININKIIDYSLDELNFHNLNNYLINKQQDTIIKDYNKIKIFETESKIYDKNNNEFISVNKLYNLDKITQNSINRLNSLLNENGKFTYGYNIETGENLTSYNILRHAGTVWSMIKYYEINPNENLKKSIDNAINYLVENIILYNNDIAYVVETKTSEIKLGGNGLALIALSEYAKTFDTDKFQDISIKLANGIIAMQNNNGSYIHVLNLDGSTKEEFRTVYYDGEATFALLKLYEIIPDEKYLKYSEKAIDYFISNNYYKYRDHWISYTMHEFLKYNLEDKYVNFALNNYSYNKNRLKYESFGPVRFELLTTINNTYNYLKSKNISIIDKFDIEGLKSEINNQLHVLLNYYLSENIAIYYANPNKIIGGFYDLDSNYRMRIDDIQHSILGIMNYQNSHK